MFPSRAVCGFLLAILALVSALDGYAAYAAPIFNAIPLRDDRQSPEALISA